MKNSGAEWIGNVPMTWNLGNIGQLYSERKEKCSDKDYEPLSVTMKGVMPQLSTAAKTDAHDDRKLVKKGDFVINSRSDRRGSCGIADRDGSVSLINTILSPRENMNPGFYNWLFHSDMFSSEYYKWGHGIVDDLWTTNWQDMKSIIVPIPTFEEQTRIANFLDKKVAAIDNVIAKTKESIEEYKKLKQAIITETVTKGLNPDVGMKNSGVEWIGIIPSNWETIKIKYTSWLKGRIGWDGLKSTEFIDEGPYLITGTDFNNGIVDWSTCVRITEERFAEDVLLHIKEDDLLITKDGTVGKLAIAKNCPEKASLNSGVLLVRNDRAFKYNTKFLYYILSSNQFKLWYNLSNVGNSTIKHLYQEQFYNFEFSYPSIEEQTEIANFLDKKLVIVDEMMEKSNKLLQEYEQYKKALIYEYVTGKKEVSND